MIIERIKKLLALAKSSNEHEAAIAMQKATELMLQHGIKELPSAVVEGDSLGMDKKWIGTLGRAAATLYGVKALFYHGSHQFRFVGRPENLAAAEVTTKWLMDQVGIYYKAALPAGLSQSVRSQFRREFKEACAIRVYHRALLLVKDQEENGASGCTALVVQGHRAQLANEADNHIKASYSDLKDKNIKLAIRKTEGGLMGVIAGDRVELNRKMDRQDRN